MSHMISLLQEMRQRPLATYLGQVSILKLADFLRGYEYALIKTKVAAEPSFLAGFRDWIHQRFQTKQMSWEVAILQHSASEADAVNRFWELIDEYLKRPISNDPATPTDGNRYSASSATGAAAS
jgi:hypothetical protein